MSDKITFNLDGKKVIAELGESIWQVAKRQGTTIPHLCWKDEPGYRADGNCRACIVSVDEIERVSGLDLFESFDDVKENSLESFTSPKQW